MLEAALQQYFGYQHFREGQQDVIEAVMRGEDVIAVLPTGTGKSLCYQLPTKLLPHATLIISPLLSLMQDQVDQLKRFGEKRVIALNSFLNRGEKQEVLQKLGQYEYIFTSPEMLQQPHVQQALQHVKLSLIVVDEAHCLSQWGFDFRPDYLQLASVFDSLARPGILALSATATTQVLVDIKQYLQMRSPHECIHSVDRPTIRLMREHFETAEQKVAWAFEYIRQAQGAGIFYTQSRAKCEQYAAVLVEQGVRIAYYHGGMELYDRQLIQQQFLQGQLDWIVATNAFGMGVHKDNIRHIMHETLPQTMANYMQEIGRAGRDGQPAIAILLYAQGDEERVHYIATEDLPQDAHVDAYDAHRQGDVTQLVTNGWMTETQFRVLHYWMQQLSNIEMKHFIGQLRLQKREQIIAMQKMVDEQSCLRQVILHYFGQTLQTTIAPCCSNCGATYQLPVFEEPVVGLTIDASWQKRLLAIFPQ